MPDPQPNTGSSPLSFSERCRQQRTFIIFYCCLILLPLALLIGYFCYDKGVQYEYGQVRVTSKFTFFIESRTQSAGMRGGGSMTTPARLDYSVWAKTKDGRLAFIDVPDEKAYRSYHRGDVVTTRYTFHKDAGDWGWTKSAEFMLKVWLLALLIMLIRIRIKGRNQKAQN